MNEEFFVGETSPLDGGGGRNPSKEHKLIVFLSFDYIMDSKLKNDEDEDRGRMLVEIESKTILRFLRYITSLISSFMGFIF